MVTSLPCMDANVIAIGFHPFDRLGLHINDSGRIFDGHPLGISRLLLQILKQREKMLRQVDPPLLSDAALSLLDRPFKTRPVKWLQNVIHGAGFESPQSVLIVGGNEYNQ